MSIAITFNDPANMSPTEFKLAVELMHKLRGVTIVSAPTVPIAPNDAPDVGLEQPSANAAFRTEPAPAVAFSTADNPAAAFGVDPNVNPAGVAAPIASAPAPASVSIPVAPPAAATPAGTPANAATVEVDKNGLPWDARIHAETKSKNKDQSWRYKRGVPDATIAEVEAQLRAVMAIPGPNVVADSQVAQAPAAPIAAMTAPVAPELGNVPPAPPAPPSQSIAPPPPAPAPSAPHSVPAAATPTNAVFAGVSGFVEFIGKLGPLLQSGKLTQDEVKSACQGAGVPALEMLAPRADLVPTVAAMLDAILMTKA